MKKTLIIKFIVPMVVAFVIEVVLCVFLVKFFIRAVDTLDVKNLGYVVAFFIVMLIGMGFIKSRFNSMRKFIIKDSIINNKIS